ncbi:flagellin [Sporosarcina sp. P29]|uniref:flagellin N-terminal helical domain-containing protein n=1 Tax=Sporosarcina sp. P29 TaxID=2048252 RepID=UPI000C168C19|nr:flagellin [Sporosarcina sp. P29]PIC98532.1 flagellin [Sporosarcina sp. P29]
MIINHNMAAMNTHRQLGSNNAAAANNIEKLSSGLKINKAGDDAAGLAISEKMRGQIRGLDMAAKNSQDGISLVQTAEGALNETHDILQRMRELAVQAGNDTNTGGDRKEIQKEINSLTSEINRIGNTTEFNTQKLLNGSKDIKTEAVAAGPATTTTPGVYEVTIGSADVVIDGKSLTFDAGGGGTTNFKDATELVSLINADDDLKTKYTATESGGKVVLTQKTGQESSTAPVVSGTGASMTTTTSGSVAGPGTPAVAKGESLNFQIGANENQSLTLDISDMRAANLGISTVGNADATRGVNNGTNNTITEQALDVSSHTKAAEAVTKIQTAIDTVSGERSKLGATTNRLEHTINNLGTSSENLTAAESRIRDVDYVVAA